MTHKYTFAIGFLAILALVLFYAIPSVIGALASDQSTSVDRYKSYTFLNATTTNATSTSITAGMDANGIYDNGTFVVMGAKAVDFYFTHGGTATTSTGDSTFNVQFSNNGSDWYDYRKFVSSTSTVATIQFVPIEGATSTLQYSMSDNLTTAFYALRCIVVEGGAAGTQGEHTCKAVARF